MDSLRGALEKALANANIVLEKVESKNEKVFCGPDQTFPSTTCQETEASMKKIVKVKMDGRLKSRIMKCLSSRLKSMNCRGK